MKLTIEHLAPYLPYGLKIQGQTHGEVAELSALTENAVNIKGRTYQYGSWADIFDIKPILRPLSDLTKEIEHNGEKLVPFHYIYELVAEYASRYPKRKILDNAANGWAICNRLNPNTLSYISFKILLEYHFDVFGLIDEGLAIDINTLKP